MIVKIAWKNIKNSMMEHRRIYLLMLFSQLIAVISIFSVVGIYCSYSAKMQELDIESYSLSAYFTDSQIKNLRECLTEILETEQERLDYVFIAGSWQEQVISMYTSYDGKYHSSSTIWNSHQKFLEAPNIEEEGRFLTEEDVTNGKKVLYSQRGDPVGSKVEIAGVEYEVIGRSMQHMADGTDAPAVDDVIIPYTACSDQVKVFAVILNFRELPRQADYTVFKDGLEAAFGDKVEVEEFDILDEDTRISLRSVIVVSLMIGVISALNVCLLYGYIIGRRKKQMAIYGILGATNRICLAIQEMEILLVSVGAELAGFLIFRFVLQKVLVFVYEMEGAIYGQKTYLAIFFVYFACVLAITFVMLLFANREKLTDRLRRAQSD